MPRFFFDVIGPTSIRDHHGTEFTDLGEAQMAAADLAATLLRENPRRFWEGSEWLLTVADEDKTVLLSIAVTATNMTRFKDLGAPLN